MLFTEAELYTGVNFESILSEAVYLTEEESMIKPKAIPVVENKRIGAAVVDFKDIDTLSEQYDISYLDAMDIVAEANELNIGNLAVAVDEASIIEFPWLVESVGNIVLKPISENDNSFIVVEEAINMLLENGEDYFDNILEAALLLEDLKVGDIDPLTGRKVTAIIGPANSSANDAYERNIKAKEEAKKKEQETAARGKAIREKHKAAQAALRNETQPAANSNSTPASDKGSSTATASTPAAQAQAPSTSAVQKAVSDGEKALNGPAKPGVIARVIASLRRWSEKIQAQYNDAPAEKRSIWLKIKNKIASLIQKLTKKLQSDEKYAAANAYYNAKKKEKA